MFCCETNFTYQLLIIESNINNLTDFFLYSEDELFKNAIWIIGNIAYDYDFMRKTFFKLNLHEKVQYILINSFTNRDLVERLVYLLVNLSKGNIKDLETDVINKFTYFRILAVFNLFLFICLNIKK